jgi:hypothetical protein
MNSPTKISTLMGGALLALQFQAQPTAAADWQIAAMNPSFEAHRRQPALAILPTTGGVPDRSLGYTPAPLQLPKVANRAKMAMAEILFPRRVDLRGAGGLTPDQRPRTLRLMLGLRDVRISRILPEIQPAPSGQLRRAGPEPEPWLR